MAGHVNNLLLLSLLCGRKFNQTHKCIKFIRVKLPRQQPRTQKCLDSFVVMSAHQPKQFREFQQSLQSVQNPCSVMHDATDQA